MFHQSLDRLLSQNVSESMGRQLTKTSTFTQVAQIVTNLEYFQVACVELERTLTATR
jgi:exocyst complex component 6